MATCTSINGFGDLNTLLSDFSVDTKQPQAAVVRVGGSGVDVMVSGLHDEPVHIDIKSNRTDPKTANHSADLKVVKQILASCAQQAKAMSQPIMDVVFGVAGFATKADPTSSELFNQDPEDGHIYMNNAYDNGKKGLNWNALEDMKDIASRAGVNLSYRDEAMSEHRDYITSSDATTQLRVTVMNDTVAVAASAAPYLQEGENSIGLVDGSGMNGGTFEGYNPITGQPTKTTNRELGQAPLPKPQADQHRDTFITPLDEIYIQREQTKNSERVFHTEEFFAGGSLAVQAQTLRSTLEDSTSSATAMIPVLQHLNKYLPNQPLSMVGGKLSLGGHEYNSTILTDNVTGERIGEEAKKGDPLARALTLSLAERSANLMIVHFKDLLKDPKTTAFAMTGSHLLHGVLDVPGAEEAFIGKIQEFRNVNGQANLAIIKHEREAMDGLASVLEGKIALARAVK